MIHPDFQLASEKKVFLKTLKLIPLATYPFKTFFPCRFCWEVSLWWVFEFILRERGYLLSAIVQFSECVDWSEWLSIYWGWQVKFSADKIMHTRGDNLNFSHTLQISKLIAVTEGRDGQCFGQLSKNNCSVRCKRKMLGHLKTIFKILKYFNIIKLICYYFLT